MHSRQDSVIRTVCRKTSISRWRAKTVVKRSLTRAPTSSSATGSVLIAAAASFPQTNRSSLVSVLWLDYDYEHEQESFIRLPRRCVVKASASLFQRQSGSEHSSDLDSLVTDHIPSLLAPRFFDHWSQTTDYWPLTTDYGDLDKRGVKIIVGVL